MPNRVTRSSPSCVANFPENESHFNDAYENNPYLQKVREKQEQNKQKLKELGLDKGFNLKRRIQTGKKRRELQFPAHKPSLKKKGIPNTDDGAVPAKRNLRRSSRQSKKPPMYTGIDEFNDASALGKKIAKRRNEISSKGREVKRRVFDLGSQIDKKERDQFTSVSSEEWIDDMTRFFREKEDNSVTNVQRTMSVVKKLVSGYGVQHPATKEFFKKNEKIHLNSDFRSMLDDATEWVYSNGGDRGNGWLVEHPIKKCWVYQQARASNGSAFFYKTKP